MILASRLVSDSWRLPWPARHKPRYVTVHVLADDAKLIEDRMRETGLDATSVIRDALRR